RPKNQCQLPTALITHGSRPAAAMPGPDRTKRSGARLLTGRGGWRADVGGCRGQNHSCLSNLRPVVSTRPRPDRPRFEPLGWPIQLSSPNLTSCAVGNVCHDTVRVCATAWYAGLKFVLAHVPQLCEPR